MKYLCKFDKHICISEEVFFNNKGVLRFNLSMLLPYMINKSIKPARTSLHATNVFFVYISGNMTSHRRRQLTLFEKTAESLFAKGILTSGGSTINRRITVGEAEALAKIKTLIDSGANVIPLEIYIGQSIRWPYLSPMRIKRTIKNGGYTLSIGSYMETRLTKVTLSFDYILSETENRLCEFATNIESLIEHYNNEAKSCNYQAVREVISYTKI